MFYFNTEVTTIGASYKRNLNLACRSPKTTPKPSSASDDEAVDDQPSPPTNNLCVLGYTNKCTHIPQQGSTLLLMKTGPGGSVQTTQIPSNTDGSNLGAGGNTMDETNNTLQKGMGCTNWAQIMLTKYSGVDLAQCQAKCNADKQCQSYNYQADECQPGDEGLAAKTCYLYQSQCVQQPNPCWDLGYNPGFGPFGQTYYQAHNTGCSNWADGISLGLKKPSTWEQCEKACNDNPECKYYNYQDTLDCKGNGFDDAHGCYLFKKTCQVEKNDCWTLNTKK